MPVGYSARCRVCNSAYRAEIEKWCKEEGLSPRAASARLLEQYKEKISHKSIWQHMTEHFDVRAEAREQYLKSKQQMDKLVQKHLNEIEMLERVAAVEYELHQATGAWLTELVRQRARLPMALVALHEKTASELRQTVKTKAELLGNDPVNELANALRALWEEDADGADTAAAGEAD